MKKPSCFQVTKSAIIGIARSLLTSHDGSGASGPRIVVDQPVLAEQEQPHGDQRDAGRHVGHVVRRPGGRSARGSPEFRAVARTRASDHGQRHVDDQELDRRAANDRRNVGSLQRPSCSCRARRTAGRPAPPVRRRSSRGSRSRPRAPAGRRRSPRRKISVRRQQDEGQRMLAQEPEPLRRPSGVGPRPGRRWRSHWSSRRTVSPWRPAGRPPRPPCRRPSLQVALAEDHRLEYASRNACQISTEFGHVRHLDGARGLLGERSCTPGSRRSSPGRWSARSLRSGIWPVASSSLPSCSLLVANFRNVPRGAAGSCRRSTARRSSRRRRCDLLGGLAVLGRDRRRRPSPPCRRRPRSPTGRRSPSRPCRRRTSRRCTSPAGPGRSSYIVAPEVGRPSSPCGGVERRLAVLDQLLASVCGGVQRVEVEPGLEELAASAPGRSRPWPRRSRRSSALVARNSS